MLSTEMEAALNRQITREFESAYVYRQMQAWFSAQNLDGFAHWMDMQAGEELDHFRRLFDYMLDRGGNVKLGSMGAPQTEWPSTLAVAEAALAHEQFITASINEIVNLAKDERDNATEAFLSWFVSEQVEEEASVDRIVQRLKLAGDATAALFMIDSELASRTPEPADPGA